MNISYKKHMAEIAKHLLCGHSCETCSYVADQPFDCCCYGEQLKWDGLPKIRICENYKQDEVIYER